MALASASGSSLGISRPLIAIHDIGGRADSIGRHQRTRGGPRIHRHRAEGLIAGREGDKRARRQQRAAIIAPAEEAHAIVEAQPRALRLQLRLDRPFAGDPDIEARNSSRWRREVCRGPSSRAAAPAPAPPAHRWACSALARSAGAIAGKLGIGVDRWPSGSPARPVRGCGAAGPCVRPTCHSQFVNRASL